LQLHNFTRDCLSADEFIDLRKLVLTNRGIDDPMKTLARALRPTLVPDEGNVFVVGDWSAIEACALPWLADDPDAAPRLALLADPEADLYQTTADQMGLGVRQIGKVAELALGYAGGKGAFKSMGQLFGVMVEDHEAQRIVDLWRQVNAWAERFWNKLEAAAKSAVARPGKPQHAGRVTYQFYPALLDGTLVCTLPDGSMIQYPKAKLEEQESPYGTRVVVTALKANWKPAAGEREWPRVTLWRGLLAENVTQAVCAALLRGAIRELLANDWPVVAHVHDEVVLEVPENEGAAAEEALQEIMEDTQGWAIGLPLRAEPTIMTRYGK
jgi:DNA polymerase